MDQEPISLRQQVEAADREVAMRRRVYPRWVADKRMTQEKADFEIRAMEAIRGTLRRLIQGELL